MLDGARVRSSAFYRSVIRSDERLDYGRVDRIFDGRERASGGWGAALEAARAAAAALEERRASQVALSLESSEPEFEFDRQGNVVSAEPIAQTEAHRLIEHLMIAANEQVARLLVLRGGCRRCTECTIGPTWNRLAERLIDQLASLGVPTPPVPKGHIAPQQAADLIGEASQLIERWTASHDGQGRRALTSLVLRSLKKAYYDQRNRGHAGLQLAAYCHFTSPIRRYPDLVCHRALLSTVTGDEPAPKAAWVAEAGPWSSAREREAMSIERDADDIASCFLLERSLRGTDPEDAFDGEVVGLPGAGAFVAFGSRGSSRGASGAPAAWRLVGAQRAGDDARRDARRRHDPPGGPGAGAGGEDRGSARPGRPAPGLGGGLSDGQGPKAKGVSRRRRHEPAGVLPVTARALRVRARADRHRGQVAPRGSAQLKDRMRSCAMARCG